MRAERPAYFERGHLPRLIPSVADTNREERALSIFLSSLMSVHEFRQVMLQSLGLRTGKRATLEAWVEVVFKNTPDKDKSDPKRRPDGALIVRTGKKEWRALIEAKIGNDEVGEEQLTSYIKKAKEHNFDAVITITNQFTAIPDHHPVPLTKRVTKGIDLYHWSWTYALTQAELLLQSDGIEDTDQHYILSEVVEYFDDKNSGKSGFTSMNKEWKDLVQKCLKGSTLNKSSPEVVNTVSSWHQEQRELCLKLWTLVNQRAEIKLPRAHKNDPNKRLSDDCEQLAKEKILTTSIQIPNAASVLEVRADLTPRYITCSMRIDAPKDKVSSTARLNWLLRQLPNKLDDHFFIKANRQGRAAESEQPINALRENPKLIEADNSSSAPTSFDVYYQLDLAGKFQGNRVFIEQLEQAVPYFYDNVGQHLRAWVAPPPKVRKKQVQDPEEKEAHRIDKNEEKEPSLSADSVTF
ncbi:hypothetical protein [Halomonas sp. SCS19]|uniref:hypothetical protein n=1 Tax=Halomonas sp. SCS19 TaxID=2950870 RepID=UPI0032DF229F